MAKRISLNGHLFPEAAVENLSKEDLNRLRNGLPLMTRRGKPREAIDMKAILKEAIVVEEKAVVKEKEEKKPEKKTKKIIK